MPVTLHELVEQPFGPYAEAEALLPSMQQTTEKNPISLECLVLEHNGKITGLDECEAHPEWTVRFLGTLSIRSLSWLSPSAKESIENELQSRDIRARQKEYHRKDVQPSQIKLKNLYSSTPAHPRGKCNVRVTIIATKTMTAGYLTSTVVPRGLLLLSLSHKRRYAVKSMDIRTYELSRVYLSQWRLYYIIRTLLALDAGSNTPYVNKTPLEERTPDWFIDLYFKHMAYHGGARQYRPIYVSDDSDVEIGSTEGRMRAVTKRTGSRREHTLRHVSRAEVHSFFARHAEWVIAQVQGTMLNKAFDPAVWGKWYKDTVYPLRQQAAQEHRYEGVYGFTDLSLEDAMDQMSIPLPPQPSKRKSTKRGTTSYQSAVSRASRPSVSHEESDPDDLFADPTKQRTYDSDFSPPSSDCDILSDSSDLPPSSPTDPQILSLIPEACFHPPQLDEACCWTCPWPNCIYRLNLLDLTEKDLALPQIPNFVRHRMRLNLWTFSDVWARDAFGAMVAQHQDTHLEEVGVKLILINQRWKAVWRDEHHTLSQRLRKVRVDDRRPKNVVKEEDD